MDWKLAGVIAAVVIVAIVIFTVPSAAQAPESSLDRITRDGVIRACWVHYPPVSSLDAKTGKVTGHMVDSFEWIAREANLKVEWREVSWGTLAAGLGSGDCDVIVSAIFEKIPRAKAIAFTKPIIFIGDSALARKEDARQFKNLHDLNKSSVRIAVVQGESGQYFAEKNLPLAQKIALPGSDISLALAMVSAGRADVAITDSWTIRQYAREHDETVDLFANNPLEINPAGWAVRKQDLELLNFLDTAINYAEVNGVFKKDELKYGADWLHEKRGYAAG
ncbi:MAG: ABC transporter substrate-binding protein [Candidatus Micrarchaeota archaeon]